MSTHFKTQPLTFEQRRDILLRAKEKCRHWWADILDCRKSWFREKIDMSFDDIMAKYTREAHFSIIHRNLLPEDFLEIGFRTAGPSPDYFLWIVLDPKHIPEFTEGLSCH